LSKEQKGINRLCTGIAGEVSALRNREVISDFGQVNQTSLVWYSGDRKDRRVSD